MSHGQGGTSLEHSQQKWIPLLRFGSAANQEVGAPVSTISKRVLLQRWCGRPMNAETIEEAKAALRLKALAQRAAIADGARPDAAADAARHFLEGVPRRPDQFVALYWPIRDEFDCRPLLIRLVETGQSVCLPATAGDEPLIMRVWNGEDPLYPSGFGTLAPIDSAPVVEPDIVVAPLLAFDRLGTRLGYGKGHYDRTMALMRRRPQFVGLAFADQEMPLIPRGPHDHPLDLVVTERGVRHFATAEPAE
jgi:5-formyltetrahydrofolate cyclo-ligase